MPVPTMYSTDKPSHDKAKKKSPSKLVLCLDGTGNQYAGNTADTNIVKLYQKLDPENKENQYHYYQPGIGTYASGDHQSVNFGLWGQFKRAVSRIVDRGICTSFDSHVMAAYRFMMRYYDHGDKICLFGFSRGAFTARFLARMIASIGVLSKGIEEMVPFAYKSYQDYENGTGSFKTAQDCLKWMESFKVTKSLMSKFIFWGYLILSIRKTYLPTVLGTAEHIRHAVAIDERHCKFKPALMQQDINANEDIREDIKEVYFPGTHGDVGGGWLAEGDQNAHGSNDPVQLSDIALEWMIIQIQELPTKEAEGRLGFNKHADMFLANTFKKKEDACTAKMHDVLSFNGGESGMMVAFWNFLEWLPIFKRLELVRDKWIPTYFPPNMGGTRDLPSNAVIHESVHIRRSKTKYSPKNDGQKLS